jgi:hypothetical protein
MEIVIRVDLGIIAGVFGGLALFGIGYNLLVGWLMDHGYDEGYMGFIVAVGSAITIGGLAVISFPSAVLAMICFIASGVPMILGSMIRYARARKREIDALKRLELDGD